MKNPKQRQSGEPVPIERVDPDTEAREALKDPAFWTAMEELKKKTPEGAPLFGWRPEPKDAREAPPEAVHVEAVDGDVRVTETDAAAVYVEVAAPVGASPRMPAGKVKVGKAAAPGETAEARAARRATTQPSLQRRDAAAGARATEGAGDEAAELAEPAPSTSNTRRDKPGAKRSGVPVPVAVGVIAASVAAMVAALAFGGKGGAPDRAGSAGSESMETSVKVGGSADLGLTASAKDAAPGMAGMGTAANGSVEPGGSVTPGGAMHTAPTVSRPPPVSRGTVPPAAASATATSPSVSVSSSIPAPAEAGPEVLQPDIKF